MKANKLPENIEEIGSFYKNAYKAIDDETPSIDNLTAIMERIPNRIVIPLKDEKKEKPFSFFDPRAFKVAASISTVIITSMLVLAGSLAVVTVVYDSPIPQKINFFKSSKNEKSNQNIQESPKVIPDSKVTKSDHVTNAKMNNQQLKPTENSVEIEKKQLDNVPLQESSNKHATEQVKREIPVNQSAPLDNKKVLDELKEEELFK